MSDRAYRFGEDWGDFLTALKVAKFDPSQPRDPAGSDTGGQWTEGGASGGPLKVGAHGTVASDGIVQKMEQERRNEWARMASFNDSDPATAEFLAKYPTREAFEAAQRKVLEDMTRDATPAMQVPLTALTGGINADGEFKTTFDTGRTGSAMGANAEYRTMREEYEADLFNVTATGERPKYGFLLGKDAEAHIRDGVPDQYGNATVVFKNSVRSRTTFTENDSLDSRGYRLPSPLSRPSHLSAYPGDNLGTHMRALKPRGPASGHGLSAYYDEAQYHGKLSTSDISHVYLRAEPNKTQRGKLEKMSARHGFTWSVVLP